MCGKTKNLPLLSFVLVLACAVEPPSGDAKFVTLDQQRYGLNNLSLVNQGHAQELVIGYAFFDNNGCSGRYTDNRVQSDISRVLNAWLEPLRGWSGLVASKGPIVDTYTYIKGEVSDGSVSATDGNSIPHLWVAFACREGRSYYGFSITTNPGPAVIVMYNSMASNYGDYALSTLLHEVGHAFGLADTYVEQGGDSRRYNESECGAAKIVGCEPLAVMNKTSWLLHPLEVRLAADDIAGIRYVYRDIHAGERRCPAEYTPDMSTRGCRPKDPLIFAIMNGDIPNADALIKQSGALSDEDVTALINKQDGTGSTFLHYAALRSAGHGGASYHWLIEKGADITIKNNDGKTARDLLLPQIEKALDAQKTNIAQSLMSQALKD